MGEKIGTNVPIGERLREERERLGFALGAFCARVGVDRKSQFNYESGARAPGAAYLAESLGLGVDVIYVLSGVRSSEPAPPPMSASNSPTSANLSRPGDPHLLADEPAPTGGKVATSRPLADEPAPTGGKVATSRPLADEPAPPEAKVATSRPLPAGLPPREQELLRRYRAMSERDRVLVDGITLHMIEREARLASESGPVSHPVRLRRRRDDRRKEGTSGT